MMLGTPGGISVSRLKGKTLPLAMDFTNFAAIAYCCPHCHCILSAEIDPITALADMADRVEKAVSAEISTQVSKILVEIRRK